MPKTTDSSPLLKGRSAWSGKITRRLFIVFLLFALIPTLTLATLALSYVSQQASDQARELQDDQAGMLVDTLLGRLVVVYEQVNHVARTAQDAAIIAARDGSMFAIGDIQLRLLPISALDGAMGLREPRDSLDRLAHSQFLLARISWRGENAAAYLLRAVDPTNLEAGIVAALLEESIVFGDEDSRDLRYVNCLYDERSITLFATDKAVCDGFAGHQAYVDNNRGFVSEALNGIDYQASFRGVFLGSVYGAHDWRAAVIRPSAEIFADSEAFKRQFFGLAVLVILTISFASIVLIRRQMRPLGDIMTGIQRVTEKDYDSPVSVDSGDEFEEMAKAFNTMSARVSHQLLTQASMSEIDQLILSRMKKEDIVQIVLEKTSQVLPADYIAVVLLEKTAGDASGVDASRGHLYRLSDGYAGDLVTVDVELEAELLEEINQSDILVDAADEGYRPGYLVATAMPPSCSFRTLPVRLDEQVIALIVLGYDALPEFDHDEMTLALNYADRIAVALANAEWEDRLFRQAHYDGLTGLPNRNAFLDGLFHAVNRASRHGETLGIIFVDLDNFKLVNDTLGHPVGDKFIQIIADRFKDCLRADDSVARLGGDEFVITAMGSGDHELSLASISRVADRLLAAAAEPVSIEGHELRTSASIGIALYPKDGDSPDDLLRNADTAMYHAKNLGRGTFQFYSSDLNEELVELMRLSNDIRAALEKDEFEMVFQPKVTATGYELTGAEALLRWNHPERGIIRPDFFIGAAEGLGLITAIGDWTLNAVCKQLAKWKEAGIETPRIAINVSAAQLQQTDMYTTIQSLLKQYRLRGSDLELEITENLLVQDVEAAVRMLEQIRSLGVQVSIDDYGTGYSSLSYMKELPVNTLKIDRCFIMNLETELSDQAIVNSTIVLANHLNMKVLAEGVETQGQLKLLQEYGCDEIQGYYFSRPLSEAEFRGLLMTDRGLITVRRRSTAEQPR